MIIGNVRGVRQMVPDRQTRAGNYNDNDNQGGEMPSWMFKDESNREETKNRDSKKKPAQLKKNDNHATQDVKVQEGTTEEKYVEGPVLIHLLKVNDAMSSVDKYTVEDLQKKDSTLKKCFDRAGKPIIRENYVGEFFMKKNRKHKEMKGDDVSNSRS